MQWEEKRCTHLRKLHHSISLSASFFFFFFLSKAAGGRVSPFEVLSVYEAKATFISFSQQQISCNLLGTYARKSKITGCF